MHLTPHCDALTLRQYRIVKIDFAAEILEVFDRIASFTSRNIDNEKYNVAARNMSQKIVSEPKIAMRTLNQTRNVRDRRAAITRKLNHTDDRMQRRERIGRDFRTRRRDFSQQRRFSRIRITDESSIGNRAQLEQKM